jgi:hypothetical protein
MKRTEAFLVGCLAIFLAGCALGGAPKTAKATPPVPKPVVAPAPERPQPLSIPQTNVQLPKEQPLDPQALVVVQTPDPLPEPPTPRAPRTNRTASLPAPKPEVVAPPPEPERRPPIQEIIPAAEQKRLHDSVDRRKAEIEQILNQFNSRRQTPPQKTKVRTIRSFLEVADDAAKHGDWKQADAMTEKAQVFARELQSGK